MYFNLSYLLASSNSLLSLPLSLPSSLATSFLFSFSQFNRALEDLKASMTKLIGLYSNQIDPYFKAEEEFMKSLSEYAKKQFLYQ